MRAFLAALLLCACAAEAQAERASWYARGRLTADGEIFHPDGLTAASRTLAFGTLVLVCRARPDAARQPVGVRAIRRCVTVRINDYGPARWTGRDIDLSRGAAVAIGMKNIGVANVSLQILGGPHAPSRFTSVRRARRLFADRHRHRVRRFARRARTNHR